MRILLLVSLLCAAPALAQSVHIVNQVGMSFDPAEIEIVEGDTVRWLWSAGFHTVTNGNGSADPQQGSLFDEFLDQQNQVVEYTFEDPGVVLYFCRPHELVPMIGQVTVLEKVSVPPGSFGQVKALYGGAQIPR